MPPAYVTLLRPGAEADARPLLLLHGSNGGEQDLIPLATEIAPRAGILAVRGDVEMRPGSAFFRRFPDRRIDVDDLRARAARLAEFVRSVVALDGSDGGFIALGHSIIALGHSNGAIMATALLLDAPDLLAGAILLRPVLPFEPPPGSSSAGRSVLVVDGADDPRRTPEDGALVAEALRRAGAAVQHGTSRSGHSVGSDDADLARRWLGALGPSSRPRRQG